MDPLPNKPYASYETWVLNALLNPQLLPSPTPSPPLPASSLAWLKGLSYAASPDPLTPLPTQSTPKSLALLAIIAHEMGHIIWWEAGIVNTTCQLMAGTAPSKFNAYTWRSPVNNPPRFHDFGVEIGGVNIENFDKDNIVQDLVNGETSLAATKIQAIYGNGNWATLFATVSPDEDFIETYKLYVLTQAQSGWGLTSLKLLPWASADVITDFFNDPSSNLGKKKIWIDVWNNSRQSMCQ